VGLQFLHTSKQIAAWVRIARDSRREIRDRSPSGFCKGADAIQGECVRWRTDPHLAGQGVISAASSNRGDCTQVEREAVVVCREPKKHSSPGPEAPLGARPPSFRRPKHEQRRQQQHRANVNYCESTAATSTACCGANPCDPGQGMERRPDGQITT